MTPDARPKEIVWFERLGFAAVAFGVVESAFTLEQSADGSHTNLDVSVYVVFTIMLALIWLVARRRSATAKWILIVLVVLTTMFWLLALPAMLAKIAVAIMLLASMQFILQVAGVCLLFTKPARAWMTAK
jgi:Na+/proline symporter